MLGEEGDDRARRQEVVAEGACVEELLVRLRGSQRDSSSTGPLRDRELSRYLALQLALLHYPRGAAQPNRSTFSTIQGRL